MVGRAGRFGLTKESSGEAQSILIANNKQVAKEIITSEAKSIQSAL